MLAIRTSFANTSSLVMFGTKGSSLIDLEQLHRPKCTFRSFVIIKCSALLEVGSLSRTDSFIRFVLFEPGGTLLDGINQQLEISRLKMHVH